MNKEDIETISNRHGIPDMFIWDILHHNNSATYPRGGPHISSQERILNTDKSYALLQERGFLV